jgi:CO dehydrogenase maturation factor
VTGDKAISFEFNVFLAHIKKRLIFVLTLSLHKRIVFYIKKSDFILKGNNSMKLAVSGKGGVGKTTFSSMLARTLSDMDKRVLAIDADPDANLAAALGIANSKEITPISEMKELILERTEAKPGTIGGFFKLNPKVDDLPDALSHKKDNIKLMRLGSVKKGGSGCLCPESTLLRALVTHIVLARDEVVIMDMEAGIEHLGRATAQAVDKLIVVVEPGRRSIETAEHIRRLATEIHLKHLWVVGNKIRNPKDEDFLQQHLPNFDFLGFLPYEETLIEADLNGQAPYDGQSLSRKRVLNMIHRL